MTRNATRQGPLLLVAILLLAFAAYLNLRSFLERRALSPVERPSEPLSGRSFPTPIAAGDHDDKLFTELSPAQTGLDYTHSIDMEHPLQFLYFSGMAAGGLAVGDIDGDERPDIYIVGGPDKNKLFRQVDDFRFEDVTQQAGVDGEQAWGCGATMADVNNDGRLDLYVCNYDSPNLLYINRGNGKFTEEAWEYGLNIIDASLVGVFADYDLDGDLDLYLLTYRYESPRGRPTRSPILVNEQQREIHPDYARYYEITSDSWGYGPVGRADGLLRNNGDGTFTNVTEEAGIHGPGHGLSATWWDFNDDGYPDLYVGNDFQDADKLYRNNGDGTFTDVIHTAVPHTTWYSMGSDFGDVNNDGRLDLLATDMASRTHFKQKTTMGSMSQNQVFLQTAVPRQYMRNALFLNTGTSRFAEVAYLAGLANTDWTWGVKLDDLDNDGRIDVFVTNGSARSFTDSDIPFHANLLVGRTAWDIYKDSPTLEERNLAFRNLGDLRFQEVGSDWGIDHLGISMASACADLDRDGDLDLIVANLQEPVALYRNNSQSNRVTIRLVGAASNRYGTGSTVVLRSDSGRQVRQLQPSRGFLASNEPILHFGLGHDAVIQELAVHWPSGHVQSFRELAADCHYIVSEPDSPPPRRQPGSPSSSPPLFRSVAAPTGAVHHERPFDDYQRQPLLPYRLSQLGPGLAVADMDADGDDDLFLGGAAGEPGKLFLNGGQGLHLAHSRALEQDMEHEDMGAVWLDVDSDGDLDLYVASGGVECAPGAAVLRDRLYLNDGRGALIKAPTDQTPDVRDSSSVVASADFDRDGDVDLFVGGRTIPGEYPMTPVSRLLINQGGKLVDRTDLAPGLDGVGMVTSALWSDADGDGWLDLLVTCEWSSVKCYRNQQGQLIDQTVAAGLDAHTGWWNGIAGGDFDHDGDMDYVVTNFGLNTKYHASSEHPSLLYYGDFENSGTYHLVEAEYEDETLFPVRGKSCSTTAMPFLAERFPTYRDFAAASLQSIYTPKGLDQAYRFAINTLESGLLINDGQGRFDFRPLPRLAQASPGFGAVVTEMNGDGHPDIYLAQNFFSPQPETGNMDGGLSLLLQGKGDGSFDPVEPAASGLVVPEDATGVGIADFNGDQHPDLVVAANDDTPRFFSHRAGPAERIVAVRLKGRSGNPLAAGARITVKTSDGSQQVAELHAGGGYLAQSAPVCFFGIPEDTRIETIHVRWPDGETSSSAPTDGRQTLIEQPNE